MTEEQWLACPDPLRLPKVARDRTSARKCCLLASAHALYTPGALRTVNGRRIVEVTQAAALASAPGENLREQMWTAFCREFPDYFAGKNFTVPWEVWRRPELAPDARILNTFVATTVRDPVINRRGANDVGEAVLATLRNIAATEARHQIDEVRKQCETPRQPLLGNVMYPAASADELREAILELFPEEEQDKLRAGRWFPVGVPSRVSNRLTSLIVRPRFEEATARMVWFVRDILGNPFRPIEIRPEWREWNHSAALRIAEHIVATGNYADVPILGDALEDAGCTDEEMLRHCRTAEHVPGCWVVDALVGRN